MASWAPAPIPPPDPALEAVARVLDPVLEPLGFAAGQLGASESRAQVIFCRGDADSFDGGCIDLVIDLELAPEWQVVDVRYWGFPSDRWHLSFAGDAALDAQLSDLARTLPDQLR